MPILILATCATMFAGTCTPAVQVADSAELTAVACNLGVAHPPGYPLYTLLGNLFCRVPLSTPAARLSLLSLLAGLWTVWSVYAIGLRLTRRPWSASLSALVAATGALFWRYSSLPEVFALNAALCLAVVHLGLVALQAQSEKQRLGALLAVGLLFGLALSNHHSSAFLALLPVLVVVLPIQALRPTLRRGAIALGGLTLGLLPYIHLITADPLLLPHWGETNTVGGFFHHLLRRDYGTFQLGLDGTSAGGAALVAFVKALPQQLGFIFLPIAGVGLALGLAGRRRCWTDEPTAGAGERLFLFVLAWSFVLCGPAFISLFNIPAAGIGLQVVERFFVLPSVLLAPFVGLGLAWIDRKWLSGLSAGRARFYRWAAFAPLCLAALHNYARVDVRHNYAVEDYALNVLRTADSDALVLGSGDLRVFSLYYAQHILGIRRDVQYVDVRLLLYPWYVAQQRRLFPRFDYVYRQGNVDTLGLIRRHLRRGVPVYLANVYNAKVDQAYPSYPVGPLRRVLTPGDSLPTPAKLLQLNMQIETRLARRGRIPDSRTDPWSASLRDPVAETWYVIARMARLAGQVTLAHQLVARARIWAPWRPAPAWLE